MTEFDKEIVKAAEALHLIGIDPSHCTQRWDEAMAALDKAVAAKREAERPKLMTVQEAKDVYDEATGQRRVAWSPDASTGFSAVLTEERKRTYAVIEALPSSVEQMDATGAYVLIPRPNDRDLRERHYKLSDIRPALQPKS